MESPSRSKAFHFFSFSFFSPWCIGLVFDIFFRFFMYLSPNIATIIYLASSFSFFSVLLLLAALAERFY